MIATQVDIRFYWWFLVGILVGCVLLCVLAVVVGLLAGVASILWDIIRGA